MSHSDAQLVCTVALRPNGSYESSAETRTALTFGKHESRANAVFMYGISRPVNPGQNWRR